MSFSATVFLFFFSPQASFLLLFCFAFLFVSSFFYFENQLSFHALCFFFLFFLSHPTSLFYRILESYRYKPRLKHYWQKKITPVSIVWQFVTFDFSTVAHFFFLYFFLSSFWGIPYPAYFNLQGCHNLTFVTRSERCKSDVKLINKWKIFLVPFFQFLFSVCYRSFIKLLSVVKALADFPFSIFFVVVVVVMMQYLSSSDLCVCKIVCGFFFSFFIFNTVIFCFWRFFFLYCIRFFFFFFWLTVQVFLSFFYLMLSCFLFCWLTAGVIYKTFHVICTVYNQLKKGLNDKEIY